MDKWPLIGRRGGSSAPEDPLSLAAVPWFSVLENLALVDLRRFSRWAGIQQFLQAGAARLGLPALPARARAAILSGGNLQRLGLVRELHRPSQLVVAVYPTRGLDVRSANAIRSGLLAAREEGKGVLLISEDLNELFTISDRIVVMLRGRVVGEFAPQSTGLAEIGRVMTGAEWAMVETVNTWVKRTLPRFIFAVAVILGVFGLFLWLMGKDPIRAYADTFRFNLLRSRGWRRWWCGWPPPSHRAGGGHSLPGRPDQRRGRGAIHDGRLPRVVGELLNYLAPLVVGYFVFGPWRAPEFPDTARSPAIAGTRLHVGFFLGLVFLVAYAYLIARSRWGLELRAVGGNPEAARRLGIPVDRWILVAMMIGGALAGLAGIAEVAAIHGCLKIAISPGYGFMGFLINWLAVANPVGILVMAFLVALIVSSGFILQLTQRLPYAAVTVLMALILFTVLAKGGKG